MKKKIVFLVVSCLVVAVLMLTSCQATSPTPSKTPTPTPSSTTVGPSGELNIALNNFAQEKFYPPNANPTTNAGISSPMFDYMFTGWGMEQKPGIAERWEFAPDGMSWTFYIRKGVKFHNGEDLKADDVKFSLDEYITPKAVSPDLRGAIDRVEQIDDYTVRVYTKAKMPLFTYKMSAQPPLQEFIVPKDYVTTNGLDYFQKNPIGSGPYKFVSYKGGDSLVYEALSAHWRQVPAFKKLTFTLIPEESTKIAMMKTGNVDACEVTVEGAMDVEKAGFKTVKIASDAMTLDVSGAYNSKTKGMPTADVRVRQALSLAINRDEMSKTLFYGRASKPMPSFVGEFSQDVDLAYWRQQAATAYRYDPAEAKRLLTAAGYPDGFTIKLYAHKAISILPKLAEVVQANWLAIGVKADLQIIEESTLSDWRDADDMRLMGQAYLNDCGGYRWNSLRILRMVHSWSQKNWHMTDNAFPRLDAIADAYESETDAAKRKDLMAEAIKISMDSYVLDQLVLSPMTIAYNSNKIVADYPPAASEAAEAVLARFAPYYKHK